MNKYEDSNAEVLLDTYYKIVNQSRELARIRLRKVTFGTALISRLESFGGAWLWLLLLITSAIAIIYLSTLEQTWANILILSFGTFINYIFILLNVGPLYARITKKVGISDEQWGIEAANFVANPVSLLILLPLFVFVAIILGIINYPSGLLLLFGITIIDLLTSTYVQIGYTRNHFRDYGNAVGALLGKSNILVRNTEDLTLDIMKNMEKRKLDKNEIEKLIKLSENDLHHSQVDLETVNFRIALFAIVITLLLSQQILDLIIKAFFVLNNFFLSFGNTASHILGFTGNLELIFSIGIYILLWWYLFNILLSIIYQLSSALLFVYFNNYRAAYSLQQALTILSFTSKSDNSTYKYKGVIEKIIEKMIYILSWFRTPNS